jgi:nitroimidazol reductase NimA-like FMN-containing flavoprotein (pyridoxamine 5'-phosphate oxidase superfamily)
MPYKRAAIAMDDRELLAFLEQQRKLVCATNGPRGVPHAVVLGYVVREGRMWAWSFAKAQKVRNLERDPRATLLLEDGNGYEDFRGAMLECDVVIHRDLETVGTLGEEILLRYDNAAMLDTVPAQAPKRVGLEFVECRRATYDHRKIAGGGYRSSVRGELR